MNRLQGVAVQLLQQAQKMSLVAQGLCGLVVAFYLLGFLPRVDENVAVTPAFVVPPNVKIWTLVTATFYEKRIIYVLLDVFAIVGFSSVLQPFWSAREFALFSAVVSLSCLVSGVFMSVLLYAISQSVTFLFVSYHGMIGLVCGYVVAVKQFHPDSVPFPPPTPPTLRVKHIPLAVAVVFPVLSLCGVLSYATTWLVLTGLSSSWIYLRFFQKNQQGARGDMSESFSFATFFPEPIQPALARLGGFVYHLLVSIKVCPKVERTYDVGAPSRINITLPGTDRVDAQRRKQRALKELDERLSKTGSQPQMWPSLDEAGSSQDEQELALPPSSSHPPSIPPPDMVVVEKVPGGAEQGEGEGDQGGGSSMDTANQLPVKTDPAT